MSAGVEVCQTGHLEMTFDDACNVVAVADRGPAPAGERRNTLGPGACSASG
jgi:hypothetical protein